jgi:hypothetical protein
VANRAVPVILGLCGLLWSAWYARPAELASIAGWAFAVVWVSSAWALVCVVAARRSIAVSYAGLIGAGIAEVLAQQVEDPPFLAVKPLWQLCAIGIALALTVITLRLRDVDA